MSFFTRRAGLLAATGQRSKSGSLADNEALISCCRHLAVVAGRASDAEPSGPGGPPGPDARLLHDLAAVCREFDRVMADPALATALRTGQQPWPKVAPQLLDLLLTTAAGALTPDPSLTGLIADTVLRARSGSRAAWRLRAQAHEQWGDLGAAITAHEEYLARVDDDKLDVTGHVESLRRLRDARVALASALLDAHDVGDVLPMPIAADLHDLLSRPCRAEALDPALEEFLAELVRLPVADLTGVRDVLNAVLHCLRTSELTPPPLTTDTVRSLDLVRLGDLRSWLAGRSICLVAGPGRSPAATAGTGTGTGDPDGIEPGREIGGGLGRGIGLGDRIDGYDLVARFAAGPLDPQLDGTRTDLLVLRHDARTGWDQPTRLRLVLADSPADWVRSVRRNLVPGAQLALVDKTLRRPADQAGPDGTARPDGAARRADKARTTEAFQLLRLLDHLDVNPVIDLIGFGPGDPFEDVEQDWLRPRVRRADEHLVSLR